MRMRRISLGPRPWGSLRPGPFAWECAEQVADCAGNGKLVERQNPDREDGLKLAASVSYLSKKARPQMEPPTA